MGCRRHTNLVDQQGLRFENIDIGIPARNIQEFVEFQQDKRAPPCFESRRGFGRDDLSDGDFAWSINPIAEIPVLIERLIVFAYRCHPAIAERPGDGRCRIPAKISRRIHPDFKPRYVNTGKCALHTKGGCFKCHVGD